MAAVAARDRNAPGVPVVTVVTDLARTHAAWRYARADVVIAPPATELSAGRRREPGRASRVTAGLPVTREFWGGPLRPHERAILRRAFGIGENSFLVVLSGGAEGSGGIGRRAAAILRSFPDVDVVAVCGRNTRLKRRLDRLAARCGGRLTVTGFTPHMADLLRCCDVVVTKAGPGTIAEASCCGAPMLLTSHLPGQEAGNAELVAAASAGHGLSGVRDLIAEIGRLRRDSDALAAMRDASARMSQPGAARDIAAVIVSQVGVRIPAASARWRRQGSAPALRRAGEVT
jgi:1,2-diacylglycerol 3-beta-galactosyltransferase